MDVKKILKMEKLRFSVETSEILEGAVMNCYYNDYANLEVSDILYGIVAKGDASRKLLKKFSINKNVVMEIFRKDNLNRKKGILKCCSEEVSKVIESSNLRGMVYELTLLNSLIDNLTIESKIDRYFNNDVSDKIMKELEKYQHSEYKDKFCQYAEEEKIKYCEDMTFEAFQKKYNNIIGREKELERIEEVLLKIKKPNLILVGKAGVGKSCIVEQLCNQIVNNEISTLVGKKILRLDISGMLSGSKYRGDFEERLTTLLNLVKQKENIILFIDEIHVLNGTGATEGSIDAINILKSYLSNGTICVIGATTFEEYRKCIEKDMAFERRFEKVIVNEPSIIETKCILNFIKERYENKYSVEISEDILEYIVKLSERYLTYKNFPDKAIDLMEDSVIKAHIKAANDDIKNIKLSKNDVNNVIFQMTGIPIAEIQKNQIERIENLSEKLSSKIIGQKLAVDEVSKMMKISKSGLLNSNKPVSFIFYGPTGVGKTEFAKVLAEEIFGSRDSIVRLDMSEYMEISSVNKLIGSSPGYVGYNDSSFLLKQIKNNPYSIVLFDEIEKAHPNIFNVFLQILDDGRLTDSKGETVNFKNTIIIMTSNVGFSLDRKNVIGFNSSEKFDFEELQKNGMKELEKNFKPEFLNRIDSIVLFNKLSYEDGKKIVKILLDRLREEVNNLGYDLKYHQEVIEHITSKNLNSKYGARSLKRFIEKEIKYQISNLIFNKELKNDEIVVYVDEDKLKTKVLNKAFASIS